MHMCSVTIERRPVITWAPEARGDAVLVTRGALGDTVR